MDVVQNAVFCASSQLWLCVNYIHSYYPSLSILKYAKSLACINVDVSFEMMKGCSFFLCMWTSLYLEYNDFP